MKLYELIDKNSEEQVWKRADVTEMWAMDKLLLSTKMGYRCGPTGTDVPESGHYCVRPCVNAFGLGLGAEKVYIKDSTDHLPPGHFWCEWFEGRHLSVDYQKGEQTLCVEGFKNEHTFTKWDRWVKTEDAVPMPDVIRKYFGHKDIINLEFIGDKLIEVHFRGNPDFTDGINEFIPVWEGQDTQAPEGYKYREYPDVHGRIGAFVK